MSQIELINKYILKVVNEGGEGNFVIFEDENSGKIIQFAACKGDPILVCDIPLNQLRNEEEKMLIEMGFVKKENAYQALVDFEEAAELTDEIFTEVFNSPNYKLKTKIVLE